MARRFRFSLATLLRLRERAEGDRKRGYAAAVQASQAERERRERLVAERLEMQEEVVRLYAGKRPFALVVGLYREISWISGEVLRSGAIQSQLDQAVEEARRRLAEAQKDRKALEILRDRRKEAHDRGAARQEQAELDELSLQTRARRLAEEGTLAAAPPGAPPLDLALAGPEVPGHA